ncbi:meiotic recombination protein SPO11 isoform X5 [Lissotriton helveticus]
MMLPLHAAVVSPEALRCNVHGWKPNVKLAACCTIAFQRKSPTSRESLAARFLVSQTTNLECVSKKLVVFEIREGMSSFRICKDFFSAIDHHKVALMYSMSEMEDSEKGEETYEKTDLLQDRITSSQVLVAIENVILEVVASLSRNEAPCLTLFNRSNWGNVEFTDSLGLHMIPCCTTRKVRSDCPKSAHRFALILKILSMIYKMVQKNTYATKRDIYYTDVQLFGTQSVVDNIVNDISCMLKIPRRSLHVLSTSKGCIAGDLCYSEEDGTKINCSCYSTGKGVPDLNTRLLIRKLWDTFHIPIFTLVDADPHVPSFLGRSQPDSATVWFANDILGTFGKPSRECIPPIVYNWLRGIEIMCIYKYGSLSMSFEAHSLTVPAIRWIGILPSDIVRLNIPKDVLIPLTPLDEKKLASLQTRPYIACQPLWKKEMELMTASKMKAEIQALTSLSSDYLTRVYLPNKLQFGGWI